MKPASATTEDTDHDQNTWVQTTVRQHQAALIRYAARLLGDPDRARDVVQDAFVKLMVQPRAQIDGHVVEWLFTVCRHRALDVARKVAAPASALRLSTGASAPSPNFCRISRWTVADRVSRPS